MDETEILSPGITQANSPNILIGDGEAVVVSIFTNSIIGDVPPGPVLRLQFRTITGGFQTVSTIQYGRVFLLNDCQQVVLSFPGTYRVARPDLSPWGVSVGVSILRYNTLVSQEYTFDGALFTTDYTGLDSLTSGLFTDEFTDRFDAGNF